jgi:excisionase family DNA binding protein
MSRSETITPHTPWEDLPELLTPEEFQTVTRAGRSKTYDMLRNGEIPCLKFGSRFIRIPKTVLKLGEVDLNRRNAGSGPALAVRRGA